MEPGSEASSQIPYVCVMDGQKQRHWRIRAHEIIFEAETPAGKAFDIALIILILMSIVAVMLDSVGPLRDKYHNIFVTVEWVFTILFTIEYALRIYTSGRPWRYIFSFYGIIDLLAILPAYLSLAMVGTQSLMVIRTLRLLRIFRILKLGRMIVAADTLLNSLRASRHKIAAFLGSVLVLVIVLGSIMHLLEGSESGFDSIPRSIYWAIVTLTTVGYGDITPQTVPGQFLASIIMILGYAIIAVPTGIITSEMTRNRLRKTNTQVCNECHCDDHEDDAKYCRVCGTEL